VSTDPCNATGYGKSCDTVQDLHLHPAGRREDYYHWVTLRPAMWFVAQQTSPHRLFPMCCSQEPVGQVRNHFLGVINRSLLRKALFVRTKQGQVHRDVNKRCQLSACPLVTSRAVVPRISPIEERAAICVGYALHWKFSGSTQRNVALFAVRQWIHRTGGARCASL